MDAGDRKSIMDSLIQQHRNPLSHKVLEVVDQKRGVVSHDETIINQVQEILKMCDVLWLHLDSEMKEAMSPMPGIGEPVTTSTTTTTTTTTTSSSIQPRVAISRMPAGFPFPSSSPSRPCRHHTSPHTTQLNLNSSVGRRQTLPCGTPSSSCTFSGRSSSERLPRIEQQHHGSRNMRGSSITPLPYSSISSPSQREYSSSLPHLRRDTLQWSKIPRRIESISSRSMEGLIRTPKMVKSAKSSFLRSPLTMPYSGTAHSTSVPTPVSYPELRRLCPLVSPAFMSAKPHQSKLAFEEELYADDYDDHVPNLHLTSAKGYTRSGAAHCRLPFKPLIHSHQRSQIPRRVGTSKPPTWSDIPSPIGIRQNILISYHTAHPDTRRAAAASVKHRRHKKALPEEFRTRPVVSSSSKLIRDQEQEESGSVRERTNKHPDHPQTAISTAVEPKLTGPKSTEDSDKECSSPFEESISERRSSTDTFTIIASTSPLMPEEEDKKEQQEQQEQQQYSGVVTAAAAAGPVADVPQPEPEQEPAAAAMKGMKSPPAVMDPETSLETAAEAGSGEAGGAIGVVVPALITQAAEEMGSTCVSIVIDGVEEDKLPRSLLEEPMEPLDDEVAQEVDVTNPEIKLQSILDYVKIRRNEFAKLLEEHAEIVHEINKFEGGVTS